MGETLNPTLKSIFEILVIVELIFVEQYFIINSMKKKGNVFAMIISSVFLTIGIVLLMVFVLSGQEGYGDGGGKTLIIGIVYVFPPLIFSKMPLKDKVIIIFSGFAYGLLIYALSLRFAYFFNNEYLSLAMVIIQTVLYVSSYIAYSIIKKRFPKIDLLDVNNKIKNRFLILVLLAFFLIISFNTNLTRDDASDFHKLWSVLLLIAFVTFTFILTFELWKENNQNKDLSSQIKIDKLTGLKNRSSFKLDIAMLFSKKVNFSLIYIDLDKFKTINDKYGHSKGDSYLSYFAEMLIKIENKYQSFYRMSGDEFCCLTTNLKATEGALNKININTTCFEDIKFLGFSYGIATYPDDANNELQLIQHADMNMYHSKNAKGNIE